MSVQAIVRALSRRAEARANGGAELEIPTPNNQLPRKSDAIVDAARLDKAARVLQRRWLLHRYNKSLDRQNLINRLLLEDKLVVGVCRLVLFALIFWLLVSFTSTGLTPVEQLEVRNLLERTLFIEEFLNIRAVEELQDFVPKISESLKRFAPSGSERIPQSSLQIQKDEISFVRPVSLQGVDLPVSTSSTGFTFSAWTQIPENNNGVELPLLRKPYPDNRALSCWGLFLGPTRFVYGAHDFHSLGFGLDGQAQEVVSTSNEWPTSVSHEAVVAIQDRIVFFRNGAVILNTTLPRALTDCGSESLELGSQGLTVAAFKFYPRALQHSEIAEIFKGGQPLSELATSTAMPELPADRFKQVLLSLDNTRSDIEERLETAADERSAKSIIDQAAAGSPLLAKPSATSTEGGENIDSVFYPFDPAPEATLLFPATAHLLPAREGWKNRTALDLVEAWVTDAHLPGHGQYWKVLGDPVYVHLIGLDGFSQLPDFADDLEAISISFWVKALDVDQYAGGILSIHDAGSNVVAQATPLPPFDDTWLAFTFGGIYSDVIMQDSRAGDIPPRSFCLFGGTMNDRGRIEETYSLSNFLSDPGPIPWRFMTFTVHLTEKYVQIFLDGSEWGDSRRGAVCSNNYLMLRDFDGSVLDSRTPAEFLRDAKLTVQYNLGYGAPTDNNPGVKFADLRIYPKMLSATEIAQLHEQSFWSGGTVMRQCIDSKLDANYFDPTDRDHSGHSCAWYAAQSKLRPEVCGSKAAKKMCPVACKGVRQCHDGSWNLENTQEWRRRYRVFDRIMWLSPSEQNGLMCPAKSMRQNLESLLAQCASQSPDDEPVKRYFRGKQTQWVGHQKMDPTNCTALRAALSEGQQQCEWDDSWMSDFMQDYEETQEWSLTFWMKPTASSKGMPRNFWPSVSLYSSVSPPSYLVDTDLLDPTRTEWQNFLSPMDIADYESDAYGGYAFAFVFPIGCCTDPVNTWTLYHTQMQKLPDGTMQFCGTVNNIPLRCYPLTAGAKQYFANPRSFLQALEFTTAVLVSPVEITSETYSPSEVQGFYYEKADSFELMEGPRQSEAERIKLLETFDEKSESKYDERLILVSPPILSQTRSQDVACERETTKLFLGMHQQLAQFTHCPHDTCPWLNSSESIFSCMGKPLLDSFMGISPMIFGAESWYNDFLYSLADSPFVVRNGQTFNTAEFIDSHTHQLGIVSFLNNPLTGDMHQLQLSAFIYGSEVQTTWTLNHMSYLDADGRGRCTSYLIPYAVLIGIVLVYNFFLTWEASIQKKTWGLKCTWGIWGDIYYDIGQCIALVSFTVVWMQVFYNSESTATNIATKISEIPWTDPDRDFDGKIQNFFAAVTELSNRLAEERQTNNFGFGILIVMLLRILKATEVHPRLQLLIGTVMHGLNDLWHFAVLFIICFYHFAMVSTWSFGSVRNDFKDLETSMQSQFNMLLGNLPEEYFADARMIVYVALTNIVMFFLMFNFLLAIVVEAYEKVRDDIEENEVENEFFYDCALTVQASIRKMWGGWPGNKQLVHLISHKIGSKSVDIRHLRLAGLPPKMSKGIILHYYRLHPAVRSKEVPSSVYEQAIRNYKDAVIQGIGPQEAVIQGNRTQSLTLTHPPSTDSSVVKSESSVQRTLSVVREDRLGELEQSQVIGSQEEIQNRSGEVEVLTGRIGSLEQKVELMLLHQKTQMDALASLLRQHKAEQAIDAVTTAPSQPLSAIRAPVELEQKAQTQVWALDHDHEISTSLGPTAWAHRNASLGTQGLNGHAGSAYSPSAPPFPIPQTLTPLAPTHARPAVTAVWPAFSSSAPPSTSPSDSPSAASAELVVAPQLSSTAPQQLSSTQAHSYPASAEHHSASTATQPESPSKALWTSSGPSRHREAGLRNGGLQALGPARRAEEVQKVPLGLYREPLNPPAAGSVTVNWA